MNNVNMINNNVQFNPYATSPDVKAVDQKVTNNNQMSSDNNASVNEYGDEFVRSSIIKTEDGAVYNKPRNSEDNTARVPREEELPKIDSLVGYTASQVQRFYYEGRISRHDYDVKMEQKSELLKSEGAIANPKESQVVVSTADESKRSVVREALTSEGAKAETVKADARKVDVNKAEAKKVDEKARQDKAGSEKVYNDSRDMRDEIISKAEEDARVLNAKMSAIDNEKRNNEEFEVIESGNDAAATFRLVQNLSNLGSGVEGGTWNIA
jgi:hypothetical protein